jgi:hypothetical protein
MLAIPKVSASEPNLLGGIFLLRGISKLKRLDSQVDKSVDRKVSWEAIAPDLEQGGIWQCVLVVVLPPLELVHSDILANISGVCGGAFSSGLKTF